MMVPFDDLLPEVLAYVPNCADPIAFRYLREAARDLCKRGHVWRESDSFTVSAPDAEAVVTSPDTSLVTIAYARLGEIELTPVTVAYLDEHVPGWAEAAVDAEPARFITQLTPNTVTVAPKATGTLSLRLVLMPSRSAEQVPDWMLDQYGEQLGKGAAGRIMMLTDATVANPALGAQLLAEFAQFLDRLALAAAKGQQRAALRTRGRFF